MEIFSYKTKNKHTGLIEIDTITASEIDIKYNSIDDFINELELKIKTTIKDDDININKNEIYNEYKEHFNIFIKTKECSSQNLISSIFKKTMNEYIARFNNAFPAMETFQHILDEKKLQFKPIILFCWNIINNINIPFVINNKDIVLKWFDDKLETCPIKLKELKKKAMIKWGKQIISCNCGKNYLLYNKHHHIITKHHLDYMNNITNNANEDIVNENLVMNFIMNNFILTNNLKDIIACNDIQQCINKQDANISMCKFRKFIDLYCNKNNLKNIFKKDKRINNKTIKCWFGIQKKE